ncbi:MAG: type I glutamate--ammonia ligase [bacterium]|nr:type I glutamate--ammonia ligase [bacterium]
MVDLRMVDPFGEWQHFSVPVEEFTPAACAEGIGFDGSSIRMWQGIEASDMLVIPDLTTARRYPFFEHPTLAVICDVKDPVTGTWYDRDPRRIAKRAEEHLKSTGIADTVNFGPELEFFVFDHVAFETTAHRAFFEIDSEEGIWNRGESCDENLGHRPAHKRGYFPTPPVDTLQDLRSEMVLALHGLEIPVEAQHHEVATAGQCEIDMRFTSLVKMADSVQWYKDVVKNVAKRAGKTATFMPKPMLGDNGSGMHCHQSLWKAGQPLFAGTEYAGISQLALWYIGGILKHVRALNAITNPTTNSYRRLVPGYEAPVNVVYSSRNRSAAVRIPMYSQKPAAKRLEVRFPDPSANAYLAFSAMLMAGLDGIENKIDPGSPLEKDTYHLGREEAKNIPTTCSSLTEALKALEDDHEFLVKDGVFSEDFIKDYIAMKRTEADVVRLQPTPGEYELYYSC